MWSIRVAIRPAFHILCNDLCREEIIAVKIHIVQKGESLWKIAKKYGVDIEQLKKANSQIVDPSVIYPGAKVKVPTGGHAVKKKEMPKESGKFNIPKMPFQKKEKPIKEKPIKEQPKKEVPKKELPKMEQPKKMPIQEQPKKVQPKKDLPKMDLTKKPVAPKKDIIPKDMPQKDMIPKQDAVPKKEMSPQNIPYKKMGPFAPIPDHEFEANIGMQQAPSYGMQMPAYDHDMYCEPISGVMPGAGYWHGMPMHNTMPMMPYSGNDCGCSPQPYYGSHGMYPANNQPMYGHNQFFDANQGQMGMPQYGGYPMGMMNHQGQMGMMQYDGYPMGMMDQQGQMEMQQYGGYPMGMGNQGQMGMPQYEMPHYQGTGDPFWDIDVEMGQSQRPNEDEDEDTND
jgi:morphogenetic protein associated with SpoVID